MQDKQRKQADKVHDVGRERRFASQAVHKWLTWRTSSFISACLGMFLLYNASEDIELIFSPATQRPGAILIQRNDTRVGTRGICHH